VEYADVRERATHEEVVDAVSVQVALEVGLVERVVGVLLDDVVRLADVQVVVQFGVPGALDDVLAPARELVVVVGVLELLGRVDVPRVDDARTGVPGPRDEARDGVEGVLAGRRVEAPFRVAEAVLHVHDDDGGAG
jgi:hypothetical protein